MPALTKSIMKRFRKIGVKKIKHSKVDKMKMLENVRSEFLVTKFGRPLFSFETL